MILNISEVTELKKAIAEKFSSQIHFHDGCGGQYFSIEKPAEELREFIISYFRERNQKALFSESGEYFSIEGNWPC